MVCRRWIALSTATFNDAVLSSFIIPFGPLLLVHFLQEDSSGGIGGDVVLKNETRSAVSEASLQWMASSRLWSQAFAGFVVGRTAGRLGPHFVASSAKTMSTAVLALAFLLTLATYLWLGWGPRALSGARSDAKAVASQLFWARCLGGFFSGLLCNSMLLLTGPCPPSSSCERCDALPLQRNVSEIRFTEVVGIVASGGSGGSGSGGTMDALRRADRWWLAGLVSGPLIGGLLYGRTLGWRWLDGVPAAPGRGRLAFVACVGVCLCVLTVAAWRTTGFREVARTLLCFRMGIRGRASRTASTGRRPTGGGERRTRRGPLSARRNRRGSGAEFSRLVGAREEEDDGEETPLIGDASMHSLALGIDPPEGITAGSDLEAELGRIRSAAAAVDYAPVPSSYLKAWEGDAATARKMWQATVKCELLGDILVWRCSVQDGPGRVRLRNAWREEARVDDPLQLLAPHPRLGMIRDCYPRFAHGRSREGDLVVYELAGRMQFDRLARSGVTPLDVQVHCARFNDFVFSKLLLPPPPRAEGVRLMTVLDFGGLRLSTIRGNATAMKYLAAMSELMARHYPGRQGRVLVMKAPWWFGVVWPAISNVMSRGSREKPKVLGANYLSMLLELVDTSQIPPEYGGSSPHPLGFSPEEYALQESLIAGLEEPDLSPVENSPPLRTAVAAGVDDDASGSVKINMRDGGHPGATAAPAWQTQSDAGATRGSVDVGIAPTRGGPRAAATHVHPSSQSCLVPAAATAGDGGSGSGGESGSKGEGVTQRLASAVRRSMRGGATRAYLGVENRFRYDTAQRMWVIDGNERKGGGGPRSGGAHDSRDRAVAGEDGDDGDAGEGGEGDGSETSLIRAIQAAQEARGGLTVPSTLSARSYATGDAARAWRVDGPPPGSRIGLGLGVSSAAALILALSMAWSALDSALEVLFSLWILIPAAHGGLGFSALVAGCIVSGATVAAAIPGHLPPPALLRAIARSPVRALRVATVVQVVVMVLLSFVAGSSWLVISNEGHGAASFAVAVFAYAAMRASNIVARPSLTNLLAVALGTGSACGGIARRRAAVKVTAVGISQAIGVLAAGAVFAAAVGARAGTGVVCFRVAAVAFVGVYLATMFVEATGGAGGYDAGWRGAGCAWLATCDLVEEAMVPASASVRGMSGRRD